MTTLAELEARVAKLEAQMAELLAERAVSRTPGQPGRDDWKQTIGMFDGDPVFKTLTEETLKVREQDRRRTR